MHYGGGAAGPGSGVRLQLEATIRRWTLSAAFAAAVATFHTAESTVKAYSVKKLRKFFKSLIGSIHFPIIFLIELLAGIDSPSPPFSIRNRFFSLDFWT